MQLHFNSKWTCAMDLWSEPVNVLTLASWCFNFIIDANESMDEFTESDATHSEDMAKAMPSLMNDSLVMDTLALLSTTLNSYRLCCPKYPLSDDLGYWVKPSSTT